MNEYKDSLCYVPGYGIFYAIKNYVDFRVGHDNIDIALWAVYQVFMVYAIFSIVDIKIQIRITQN